MTKNNNTIGTILGSVFITLLLVGAGVYFGLPALYPNLNADLGDYVEKDDLTGEGILLQTKYNESQDGYAITNGIQIYGKIPNPELNITTGGNSKLIVTFEGAFMLRLSSNFEGDTRFNITLDILGVGNRTTCIHASINSALGTDWELPCNTHISFETGILPAGTYSISVLWCSAVTPTAGGSQLFALAEYSRSIYVQEIAG